MSSKKTMQYYEPGLSHVGSYQVSGTPFITGSDTQAANTQEKVEFPMVTKAVTVINHSSQTLRLHFTDKDEGNTVQGLHFIELDSDEDSFAFRVKCKEIYISTPSGNSGEAAWKLYAELTHIPAARMYPLTGSGLTD